MKNILFVSALLLLISGTALAGSRYDECVKEEKTLKTREAGDCNGLRYILNPSACFASQKALKAYASGKCRQIGAAEKMDSSAPIAIPEKKSDAGGKAENVSTTNLEKVVEKKAERGAPQQEYSLEQLKEENVRLKAEIKRLTTENEQLRKTVR